MDVVQVIIKVTTHSQSPLILNVGTGSSTSLQDLLALAEWSTGHKKIQRKFQPAVEIDALHTRADTANLLKHIEWVPDTPLSIGFPQFISWYQACIGVVIATHQRTDYLFKRALPSVLAQRRTPDFIIIVDDNNDQQQHVDLKKMIQDIVQDLVGKNQRLPSICVVKNTQTKGASGG
jgi:hypothetical protein